jgi:hypothetical protein
MKSNRATLNVDSYEAEFEDGFPGYPRVTCSPGEECELIGSVLNRTRASQDTYGATGQFTFDQRFDG